MKRRSVRVGMKIKRRRMMMITAQTVMAIYI
jgi:hypothetical protein